MITNFNNYIACEPFPSLAIEIEKKSGFALVKQKNQLYETKVVYRYTSGNSQNSLKQLEPGWKVYLNAEDVKTQKWGSKVFRLGPEPSEGESDNRTPFILIPETAILMYDDLNVFYAISSFGTTTLDSSAVPWMPTYQDKSGITIRLDSPSSDPMLQVCTVCGNFIPACTCKLSR